MLVLGEHDAVEQHLFAALHLDGGEVLDLQVADFLGVVLGIEPDELGLRELARQRLETGAVGPAGIAPFGAQAGDAEFLHVRFGQRRG